VIQTDEGIRMHLPSLDESSVSANLSEVSFRLRAPRGETEDAGPTYTDVPDLRGQPHEVAAHRLAAANLAVGTVERATDRRLHRGPSSSSSPSPTPSPSPDRRSILCFPRRRKASRTHTEQPDTPNGPTAEPVPESDADAGSEVTTPDSQRIEADDTSQSKKPEPTTSEPAWKRSGGQSSTIDPENGAAVVERLRRAGVTDLDSLIKLDPRKIAAELSLPVEQIVALQKRLGSHGESVRSQRCSPESARRTRADSVKRAFATSHNWRRSIGHRRQDNASVDEQGRKVDRTGDADGGGPMTIAERFGASIEVAGPDPQDGGFFFVKRRDAVDHDAFVTGLLGLVGTSGRLVLHHQSGFAIVRLSHGRAQRLGRLRGRHRRWHQFDPEQFAAIAGAPVA